MRRTIESLHPVGKFGVLFLIVVGGSIAATRAGEMVPQTAGYISRGLGIVMTATAGIVWLSHIGPGVDVDRGSLLGGVGGLSVLVIITVLDGGPYVAAGLAVGAGVCVGIGYFADLL